MTVGLARFVLRCVAAGLACVPGALAAGADTGPGTLTLALSLDAGGARVVGASTHARAPLEAGEAPDPRPVGAGGPAQVELVLVERTGTRTVRRLDVEGLCLAHGPGTPPHVEGDRIRLHAETLLVEWPASARRGTLEVAYYRDATNAGAARGGVQGGAGAARERVVVGALDLASAGAPGAPDAPDATPSTLRWPEEYGDAQKVRTWGDAAESGRRINVVIVPDGFTYGEKALMESSAQQLVDHFLANSPFLEHAPFVNFHLVYAYSTQSEPDECDCGNVRDTAMNTGFDDAGEPCGGVGNRCLFYDNGCDGFGGAANIALAELRAPARDETIVMVNTGRYGGCGGYRAVYAAYDPDIALHEIGHSLANLADEYEVYGTCGSYAGEINTSRNGVTGAWPEWADELGPPTQGAEYYPLCVYRPQSHCKMREVVDPYCPVCNQQWALSIFGHARITATAPVASFAPASPHGTPVDTAVPFTLETRLSPEEVGNRIVWTVSGPAYDTATVVARDVPSITTEFSPRGRYKVVAEVTADTFIVKPQRTSANLDVVEWVVNATGVAEVSRPANRQLRLTRNGDATTLSFQDVGAAHYNVYVSRSADTAPFRVADLPQGKRDCAVPTETDGFGRRKIVSYDLDAGAALFVLVTADDGPGTEGSLGRDAAGAHRDADARCAPAQGLGVPDAGTGRSADRAPAATPAPAPSPRRSSRAGA